jgi:hypothetical protein
VIISKVFVEKKEQFSLRIDPVNPLTPELKPSAQRCLTGFCTVDFAS